MEKPLAETVTRMAVESAFEDPRFPPLQSEEYNSVTFELSLISPLIRVTSIDEIHPGIHGVYIKNAGRSGVFLPQVWKQFPDKENFLNKLCTEKAGLGKNCWQEPNVEMYTFKVEVISETNKR